MADEYKQYQMKQALREEESKKGITDIDRKIRALQNLSKYGDVSSEISDLKETKGLEEDRLGDYARVREKYDQEEAIPEAPEEEGNLNDVIRGLDNQINTLDENEPEFDKDLARLEARRQALIELNSK